MLFKAMSNELANAVYWVLTPRRKVLLVKLIVAHIVKKFPIFRGH
jgi:hypothetical protein